MGRRRASSIWGVAAAVWVTGLVALVAPAPSLAAGRPSPRIGRAMGVLPAAGGPALPSNGGIPVVYHGGPVMRGATIHAVFWAPPGYHFDPSPGGGVPGYVAMQQQFLRDAVAAAGQPGNVFSDLTQFGDRAGGGGTAIHFDPGADTVIDTHPYPSGGQSCPSPSGTATCVTDDQLQAELDRVIGPGNAAARGFGNVWLIFLPPDVDTCIQLGSCATSAYAGYHSLFDHGHGLTIYAAIPDPLVELTPPAGSDPEGNPEAESTVNTVAHELVEAITDPDGTGWMDPNGFEVGDKCEIGPQLGPVLGYGADGAPYNQLLNGHQYLIQDMWSNARGGCVSASSAPGVAPRLARVTLRQFSAQVSGSTLGASGVRVRVVLIRGGHAVARASGLTRRGGAWGPLTLRDRAGRRHAVGDDRDLLGVLYGPAPGAPAPDLIATGDGGDPFTESGYTGWFDLDHGTAVASNGARGIVSVGPCAQTGVLDLRVGSATPESPVALCTNSADLALVPTSRVGPATVVGLSSLDNRAESALNPAGALVDLRVTLGEPDSAPALTDPQLPGGGGFPTCTAYLRIRTVSCGGLVPGARYRLRRAGRTIATRRAGGAGRITVAGLALTGGPVLALVNSAGRTLSTLHVADLRVAILGDETVAAGGTCQPGDYWGAPVARAPTSAAVGTGIGGRGRICPSSGRAAGLPVASIAQTDEFSGGETITQVPGIRSTAPVQDETLYGGFIASAQSSLAGPHGSTVAGGVPIGLTIRPAGSDRTVFHAADVDTPRGVTVGALPPGTYTATWVLRDAAGDTRTVTTRFSEA